jgi:5-methylcytosine-specific restriction protein A
MNNWLISANPAIYDVDLDLLDHGTIFWNQRNRKYEQNDIVFIYFSRPEQKIKYKCIVEKIDIPYDDAPDDKAYWKDMTAYEKAKAKKGNMMKLNLVEASNSDGLNYDSLKHNGLTQGVFIPSELKGTILEYINKIFSEDPMIPVSDDKIPEGAKRQIFVNVYERSNEARNRCIKINGTRCKICGMSFHEVYGDIGKDFIHVHHITPIATIGKKYHIDCEKDLLPVCPNCHAMLHKLNEEGEKAVEKLKEIWNRQEHLS